jgi:hypothetical protein
MGEVTLWLQCLYAVQTHWGHNWWWKPKIHVCLDMETSYRLCWGRLTGICQASVRLTWRLGNCLSAHCQVTFSTLWMRYPCRISHINTALLWELSVFCRCKLLVLQWNFSFISGISISFRSNIRTNVLFLATFRQIVDNTKVWFITLIYEYKAEVFLRMLKYSLPIFFCRVFSLFIIMWKLTVLCSCLLFFF